MSTTIPTSETGTTTERRTETETGTETGTMTDGPSRPGTTGTGRSDPWAAATEEDPSASLAAPLVFDPFCTRRLRNCIDRENAALPDAR